MLRRGGCGDGEVGLISNPKAFMSCKSEIEYWKAIRHRE
jgi:hypothetical protein